MKVLSKNQTEANVYELEILVEEAEFSEGFTKSYNKNAPKLAIHGFRKGKAPKNMVMKMVGEEYFFEDAVNFTYADAYEKAVEESGLEPVDRPDISVKEVTAQGYSFVAKITNKPEVELSAKGYKGLKATRPAVEVAEEEVDGELAKMAEQNSRLAEVEDRPAQEGDTAEINFEGFLDGVPFPGGKGEGHSLVLGSGQFIPGFEEKIVGHKKGEEFDIDVTFPEEYHEESLKGKATVFKIALTGLKKKEVPAIDDELAKDVSEFDTLAELKADLRSKMEAQKKQESEDTLENTLVDLAADSAKMEIPQVMIDDKVGDMVEDFAYKLQNQGLNLETYLQYTATTPQVFRESFVPGAQRQVRAKLTLEKIVSLENIQVTDEEVEAEYKKTAENYKMDVEKMKTLINRESVVSQLSMNKAIDLLKDTAVITEEKPAKKTGGKKADASKK